MRGFRHGFGLGRGKGGASVSLSASLTGLSTDSLGTYAEIGDHAAIGYTATLDGSPTTLDSVKWSDSSNPADAATFGTGTAPTTFAALSTPGDRLYLHATKDATTDTTSALVRYAPGTAPSVADGQSWIVDTAITPIDASASGANLTFSYGATGLPSGTFINSSTGEITGTPTSPSSGTVTVTATDQYGRAYVDTFTFTTAVSAITYTDTSPVLMEFVAVVNGDTVADAFPVGVNDLANFQSSAGTIVSVVREYNLNNAGWVAEDTTAPTLSSPTDAANGATASTGSVSTNEGNGTLYWVVTTSATSPSAAQVEAGNDHTGSVATDSGSQAVSGTGVQNLSPAPSGLTASTTYYTHFMHKDAAGNSSTVSSADGFTTGASDVTAPTLSSPTDAANGATASTGSVSTNEGNGTLYWVVTTSATSPSAAQVKAGNDHTGTAATASGSQAVSTTGVQTLSPAPSGLTASTTYYTHFMHEDAATNQSAVSSADGFTTGAASGITIAASDFTQTFSTIGTGTVNLPTSQEGDVVFAFLISDFGHVTPTTAENGTQTGMVQNQGWNFMSIGTGEVPGRTVAWKLMGSTPDTTVTLEHTSDTAAFAIVCGFLVLRGVDGSSAANLFDTNSPVGTAGGTGLPNPGSYTTSTAGALRIVAAMLDDEDDTMTPASGESWDATFANSVANAALAVFARIEPTPGAFDPGTVQVNNAGDDGWYALHFAVKPAA